MCVALKGSAQNQFEIDEASTQETHVTEKSCSTAPSIRCQSMDLFEMNTQDVSSGKVLRFTAARKIPKMRTEQPGAFGLESDGGATCAEEGTRPPVETTLTLKRRKTNPDVNAIRDKSRHDRISSFPAAPLGVLVEGVLQRSRCHGRSRDSAETLR